MAYLKEFSNTWSAQWLADQFKMDRRTVIKRLRDADVPVRKEADGHSTYSLREAAPALLQIEVGQKTIDPDKLPPTDRRAYYQSENERLKLEVARENLVPTAEVERDYAVFVRLVSQFFDTLPDVLERDASLTAQQVVAVQESCDRIRQTIYETVKADAEDELRQRA